MPLNSMFSWAICAPAKQISRFLPQPNLHIRYGNPTVGIYSFMQIYLKSSNFSKSKHELGGLEFHGFYEFYILYYPKRIPF